MSTVATPTIEQGMEMLMRLTDALEDSRGEPIVCPPAYAELMGTWRRLDGERRFLAKWEATAAKASTEAVFDGTALAAHCVATQMEYIAECWRDAVNEYLAADVSEGWAPA
ncbi:hypothetical protein [Mycolicibacter arupensis]|uniref:Uncharacterized protein n=1 Tax=Mycolicibacter arupensis TaxID=342002 RepID=A0A5C7Y215_9MYCO|nr:hypothetical protein [Mycolicibacter arupensis]TXI55909.1 MAG: hypothetical protein E6Q54_11820 [Mycolicibacter arupensis]